MLPTPQAVRLDHEVAATWKQLLTLPPPTRFIATVNEYIDYLKRHGSTISQRQLSIMAMGEKSHGVLSNLTKKPDVQPKLHTVRQVVDVLNGMLPRANQWPIVEAMAAAGHTNRAVVDMPSKDLDIDYFPRAIAVVSVPVMNVARVADDGLRKAMNPRQAFNVNSDMFVFAGAVPGYPFQQAGELVLAQRASNVDGIESAWALVRLGERVVAKPRADLTRGEHGAVIGWLLGCLRFPEDEPEQGDANG